MRHLLASLCYKAIRNAFLFKKDSELIHDRTLLNLGRAGDTRLAYGIRRLQTVTSNRLDQKLFGIHFPNPIGLAAGMDKTGASMLGLDMLGFGFTEIGAVLPEPQEGNPKPRLFRLRKDEALLNRMGFNSPGMVVVHKNLKRVFPFLQSPLGINVGKNKDTPLLDAAKDYTKVISQFTDIADFFVINVSSPNTPELRKLLGKEYLLDLLHACKAVSVRWKHGYGLPRPILLKISPDQTEEELGETLEVCTTVGVAGVVATNTTLSRADLGLRENPNEAGGLSGPPLKKLALKSVRFIHEFVPELPIIACGGIRCFEDVLDYLEAGASLFQLYTALVYEGPDLPRHLNQCLRRHLRYENKTMRTLRA